MTRMNAQETHFVWYSGIIGSWYSLLVGVWGIKKDYVLDNGSNERRFIDGPEIGFIAVLSVVVLLLPNVLFQVS
jgi:hypothetical protein